MTDREKMGQLAYETMKDETSFSWVNWDQIQDSDRGVWIKIGERIVSQFSVVGVDTHPGAKPDQDRTIDYIQVGGRHHGSKP